MKVVVAFCGFILVGFILVGFIVGAGVHYGSSLPDPLEKPHSTKPHLSTRKHPEMEAAPGVVHPQPPEPEPKPEPAPRPPLKLEPHPDTDYEIKSQAYNDGDCTMFVRLNGEINGTADDWDEEDTRYNHAQTMKDIAYRKRNAGCDSITIRFIFYEFRGDYVLRGADGEGVIENGRYSYQSDDGQVSYSGSIY